MYGFRRRLTLLRFGNGGWRKQSWPLHFAGADSCPRCFRVHEPFQTTFPPQLAPRGPSGHIPQFNTMIILVTGQSHCWGNVKSVTFVEVSSHMICSATAAMRTSGVTKHCKALLTAWFGFVQTALRRGPPYNRTSCGQSASQALSRIKHTSSIEFLIIRSMHKNRLQSADLGPFSQNTQAVCEEGDKAHRSERNYSGHGCSLDKQVSKV
jgi:hypothetical protein